MYICQSQSPNSSHTHFPPWYPYICSPRLYLYFSFVNKIIYTIFFRFHICALIYNICFCLSDLLHSVWQSPNTLKHSLLAHLTMPGIVPLCTRLCDGSSVQAYGLLPGLMVHRCYVFVEWMKIYFIIYIIKYKMYIGKLCVRILLLIHLFI